MAPHPLQATYRLQFHAGFTFRDATALVPYLDALGVSHVYASSYLRAVPGSEHGYDMVDPTRLNPEVGSGADYDAWLGALRARGMGHILDLVPNHMGIARGANPWWQDVLENGAGSHYAHVFDIDWRPVQAELAGRVLLPILGDRYGAVLERGELRLEYAAGAFTIRYFETPLPVAPATWDAVLVVAEPHLVEGLGRDAPDTAAFLAVRDTLRRLPARGGLDRAQREARHREQEALKRRLSELAARAPAVAAALERAVEAFNGVAGRPRSFDRLDRLLARQPYRLAYWRVAAEEINYRRFFDINELACVRMEDPAVFELVHRFVFDLLARGAVDGLRIDHVDGLYDPAEYLMRVQTLARQARSDGSPPYLVVEKILGAEEALPDWPVDGTTGYDFLVQVGGLFVDPARRGEMTRVYQGFTRSRLPFAEVAYRSRQRVLRTSLLSELHALGARLRRVAQRNRHTRDFTLTGLIHALGEVIACFPVYRTYLSDGPASAQDRAHVEHAVRDATRRNPGDAAILFDVVRDLLLEDPARVPARERAARRAFVASFQQITSPVAAKGVEDTAFYRYTRLVSLNEVGGEPDRFGTPPDALHAWLRARRDRWPRALSATSTHDTKRSEDVRARLDVLSEVPGAWKAALARWTRLNRRNRTRVDGQPFPGRDEEYLLYQTLAGTWPPAPTTVGYRDRIVGYMEKALREAKTVTTWLNPSQPHEAAMTQFIDAALATGAFTADLDAFVAAIARPGRVNALAQLVIKACAPGVPDFYQGTELWDFSLVDPDNRRPVDYARRRALLDQLDTALAREGRAAVAARLASALDDDRTKLYATATLLAARRARAALFAQGTYEALPAAGPAAGHVFAFARAHEGRHVVAVVPRLVATLESARSGVGTSADVLWGETRVGLPDNAAGRYRNVFTGRELDADTGTGPPAVRVAALLGGFPVAVLEPTS